MPSQAILDNAPTRGHLFVVRGKIGHVVADAVIVPTDRVFKVERGWYDVVGADDEQQVRVHRPSKWDEHGWGRSATSAISELWFLDVTARRLGARDQFMRLEALLGAIAESELTRRMKGRPVPLVVLPVIGTAGGGLGHRRGEVIRRLLEVCRAFVAGHPLDIAIVTSSPAPYAALQQRRRETARQHFPSVDLALASGLGNRAHNGSLALFLGAGTSVPAGAPSWDELLDRLTGQAGLDRQALTGFDRLSSLDQAELLHQELRGGALGEAVVKIIGTVKQPAIAHLLVAALNCEGAVTTNYDQLYETAITHSGDAVASVLPTQLPAPGRRWVLKMHGDVGTPRSVVLTRDQFVAFTSGSGPAGAVLQSLLLTKHVLIVGTSMTDDNLLRLIHEVAAFRRRHLPEGALLEQFGTILDVGASAARERLHSLHFDWLTMPGGSLETRARELEIFLDAVAMYAAGDHSWLLDPEFDDLHSEAERSEAEQVRMLARRLREWAASGSAWEALVETLDAFGAPKEKRQLPDTAVERARQIATRAHRRQVDKIGVPYIEHPAMVAALVQRLPEFDELTHQERDDVVAAAWLHDVVEDTGESEDTLRAADVSARAIELVLAMTRRADVKPDDYYARLRDDRLARLVKIADIASNLVPERTSELSAETRARLDKKYAHALRVLREGRATVEILHGKQPVRIDLHTHSTCSDGTDSPEQLVRIAQRRGIAVLGITDHDTTAGWAEASATASEVGVELLRGIELSVKCDERSQHLLAYEPDPEDRGLRRLLADGVEARRARAQEMVALIQRKRGLSRLTYDDVEARAAGGVPGRPHIADALLDLLPGTERGAVFAQYLAPGSDTYVIRPAPTIEDALRVVVDAGGVPVLAHPWGRGRGSLTRARIGDLEVRGLAGLEIDHVEHTEEDMEELRQIADDLGLVITGSSDFHGSRKSNRLGCGATAPDQWERLRLLCFSGSASRGRISSTRG